MEKRNIQKQGTNELVVKSVQTDEDIERISDFNKEIHRGEDLAGLVRSLIMNHPYGKRHYWLFIEQPRTKKIISSLALIPWKINFDGEIIRAAELGFVGTLPEFRRQGMTKILMCHFNELVEREQFAFSFLQGIPYFYRQFGYEYALPLEPHINLSLKEIVEYTSDNLYVRPLNATDLPAIIRLYDRCMRNFTIHTNGKIEIWQYLMGPSSRRK